MELSSGDNVLVPVRERTYGPADHGVRLSVGQRGQCWDNAVAESFFATIKTEILHRQPWPTHQAARQAIFEYIEGWYNTRRRHSSLGYLSPATFETINHNHDQRSDHSN